TMGRALVVVAYPIADLLVLAATARLWFAVDSGGNTSLRFLLAGIALQLLSDTVYSAASLTGTWEDGNAVELGWFAFYLFLGAAALHPSVAARTVPTTREQEAGRWRFVTLLSVAVLAPLVLIVATGSWPSTSEAGVILGGAVVLYGLALARMNDLLTRLRGSLRRERIMRDANALLAAASDRDTIRSTAIGTTRSLVPDSDVWLIAPLPNPTYSSAAVVVASSDGGAVGRMLDHATSDLLNTDAATLAVSQGETPLHLALRQEPGQSIAVVNLAEHDSITGYLVVAASRRPSDELISAMVALAGAVSLANARIDLGRVLADRHNERRMRRMLQHASDVIAVLDLDLTVRYITPAAERLLGSPAAFLIGGSWLDLVAASDRDAAQALITRSQVDRSTRGELRLIGADGAPRHVDMVAAQVADSEEPGFVLTCHDVTEHRALEQQLTHQAFHDSLTGLANRALFRDRLDHAVVRSQRADRTFAVLFIDMDDFKNVNDSLGHAAGDALLCQVTTRILDTLRNQDTAARLGGDEFAVLLEDVPDDGEAVAVAQRIIDAMSQPFDLAGSEITSAVSIGVAISSSETQDGDEVMRNADLALYEAKNLGKCRYAMFVPVMHELAVDRLELTAELRRGIDNHELVVHYQPIVELASEKILGVEALVRWRHPTRGLMAPGQFIALAEETGLVVPLGRDVLRQALTTVGKWQRRIPGCERLLVSINLSARQLQHDAIVDDVDQALRDSGVPPETVMLEITESVLLPGEGVTLDRLEALSALGVRLFIDDFGTGYSSLSYLQQLPVDGIKLAREFVATLTRGGSGAAGEASSTGLVSTIRALAETLGLASIIAEGVETVEQRDALLVLGYEVGQGFLMARPMPADKLVRRLTSADALSSIA
ncbi:MAG: EAL domain-containing protein, partial [Actinomycetes bacterium]